MKRLSPLSSKAISAVVFLSGFPLLAQGQAATKAGQDTTLRPIPTELQRIATVPLGAEITGLTLSPAGDLFFNAQHPSDTLPAPFNKATVGVIEGFRFDAQFNANFPEQALPAPTGEQRLSVQSLVGRYKVLFNGGDTFDLPGFEGIGNVLSASTGLPITESNDPDFNSFISIDADSGFLFTNWEDRPGGMSRVKIVREKDGSWAVDLSEPANVLNVDFSEVGGTWVNCFGSTTPWGTPLSAEELYWDDTVRWNNVDDEEHDGVANLAEHIGSFPNPYRYGYNVEITAPKSDQPRPVKRYAMGRFSHENAVIMPDQKTAYQSDDGSDVVFFKFVADQAGDLSSGTLYAAKVTQDLGSRNAAIAGFDIEWIKLGSNSDAAIESVIRNFDQISTADFAPGKTSYISDDEILNWAFKVQDPSQQQLLSERERAIPFLESRKAAKALGATAEFRKMEGVNINYQGASDGSVPYMYMAMSEISEGMSDNSGDIQLETLKCGVVYRMKLASDYNVSRMEPAVAGGRYDATAVPNRCELQAISNPDNLIVLDNGAVIIGEDTSNHENNALWILR